MSDPSASHLYTLSGEPAPPSPVLVVAVDGWVDAGMAGSTALTGLLESVETRLYATFDGEQLIDQRARRPRLLIANGMNEGLTWPEPTIRVGVDRLGSGIALLSGPEPDFGWRGFAAAVTEVALGMGSRLMVGLGGFPAAAPHTRPIRLASTATTPELASQIGFISGAIEVPAGIEAVLELELAKAGIPAIGLWARVPHYVAAMPFPAAAVALLDALASLSGLVIDSDVLAEAAEAARSKVDELIGQSSEHLAMVRQLERGIDELEGEPSAGLDDMRAISGDEIAAELERYLRGESGDPGAPGGPE
ncbi:MAG: PAC2 family protein [Actinomycetota bacterium]|nr:PAC2 family protein [Actinomycetota bacterium]